MPRLHLSCSVLLNAVGPWGPEERQRLEWLGTPALAQPLYTLPTGEDARLVNAEGLLSPDDLAKRHDPQRCMETHRYARRGTARAPPSKETS